MPSVNWWIASCTPRRSSGPAATRARRPAGWVSRVPPCWTSSRSSVFVPPAASVVSLKYPHSSQESLPSGRDPGEQPWSLADALPQIIWTALPDGRAEYFNQRWFEHTGLTWEQSQDRGWLSMAHPDE